MTARARKLAAAALWLAAACGGSDAGSGASGYFIRISGMSFSPADLAVPPGATVTVVNDDAAPHSVTSEASAGAFTPGAAGGISFDTGSFASGQRTFTIPSGATEGTVVPYYCSVHRGAMSPANGTITVRASAQPTGSGTSRSTPGY